jgi:hypothetical protein
MNITVDIENLKTGIKRSLSAMDKAALSTINDVADEILRLSSFEVPHDTGMLQTSGHVEPDTDKSVIVGYNKVYAARLHEHPEYRFQKGRKGKYLEDPIKNNLAVFQRYIADGIKRSFV